MKEDEQSGFRDLVSAIAVWGCALLARFDRSFLVGASPKLVRAAERLAAYGAITRASGDSSASGINGCLDRQGNRGGTHPVHTSAGACNH